MWTIDLTEEGELAFVVLVKRTIEADH